MLKGYHNLPAVTASSVHSGPAFRARPAGCQRNLGQRWRPMGHAHHTRSSDAAEGHWSRPCLALHIKKPCVRLLVKGAATICLVSGAFPLNCQDQNQPRSNPDARGLPTDPCPWQALTEVLQPALPQLISLLSRPWNAAAMPAQVQSWAGGRASARPWKRGRHEARHACRCRQRFAAPQSAPVLQG